MTGIKSGTDILKALKRSPESRQCISDKRTQGLSGKQARQECRQVYGSRLGNAGRALGIVPERIDPVRANKSAQAQGLRSTPSKMGTVNEFAFGGGTPTTAVKGGFNMWYLIPLVLFIPGIQKLIGLK